jgi:hypothetical protein
MAVVMFGEPVVVGAVAVVTPVVLVPLAGLAVGVAVVAELGAEVPLPLVAVPVAVPPVPELPPLVWAKVDPTAMAPLMAANVSKSFEFMGPFAKRLMEKLAAPSRRPPALACPATDRCKRRLCRPRNLP